MNGDVKDAKAFYAVKKQEQESNINPELSFVHFLFMMYKLRKKIEKATAECKASIISDNILTILGTLFL